MYKIWIINQYSNSPDMPGHTRQYEIAKYLVNKKNDVRIYSSDFNLSLRKFLKLGFFNFSKSEYINKVKFIWLKVIPYSKNNFLRYVNIISFALYVSLRLFFDLLKGYLKKNRPDILLASSPQLPAAFLSLLIAKIFKIKFILEIRDLWPQVLIEFNNYKETHFIIRILRSMEEFLYKNSDKCIVLSEGSVDYLRKKGGKNIFWLPNGPDLTCFKKVSLPIEKNGFDEKRTFNIYYTGAHGKLNDLGNVLKAAKLLNDFPINFYFVGDGVEKTKLMNMSKGQRNIYFLNSVPKIKIPKILSKSDAILISLGKVKLFKYGVSPNKLYDAYAIGRPVISTVSGKVNDEISKFKLGVTAPPDDPISLANSIKKLFFTSREERISMANNARKLAETIYSRKIISEKFDYLFRETIQELK